MAWVVFDEIHYMQDRERGVVWEVRRGQLLLLQAQPQTHAVAAGTWDAHCFEWMECLLLPSGIPDRLGRGNMEGTEKGVGGGLRTDVCCVPVGGVLVCDLPGWRR